MCLKQKSIEYSTLHGVKISALYKRFVSAFICQIKSEKKVLQWPNGKNSNGNAIENVLMESSYALAHSNTHLVRV